MYRKTADLCILVVGSHNPSSGACVACGAQQTEKESHVKATSVQESLWGTCSFGSNGFLDHQSWNQALRRGHHKVPGPEEVFLFVQRKQEFKGFQGMCVMSCMCLYQPSVSSPAVGGSLRESAGTHPMPGFGHSECV